MAINVNGVTLPDIPADVPENCQYITICQMLVKSSANGYEELLFGFFCCDKEYMFLPKSVTGKEYDAIGISGKQVYVYSGMLTDNVWQIQKNEMCDLTSDDFLYVDYDVPANVPAVSQTNSVIYTNYDMYTASAYDADTNTITKSDTVYFHNSEVTYEPEYRVSSDDLIAIADQVRRLTGNSGKLTTEQMVSELSAVEVGSGEALPTAENVTFGTHEVVREGDVPTGKSYFNGVLLPDIPEDVLKDYPYCWIRKNESTGYYDLVVNTGVMYYNSSNMNPVGSSTYPYYRIPISGYDAYDEWVWYKETTSNFGIDSSKPVFWSNFDIPNGSASSTTIYFESTEPIPETVKGDVVVTEMLEREEAYGVSGDWLNEMAAQIQKLSYKRESMTPENMYKVLSNIHTYQVGTAMSVLNETSEHTSNATGILT